MRVFCLVVFVMMLFMWHATPAFSGAPVTIQNSYLSITLDSKTGAVISIRNEKSGVDYIAKEASGYYPFTVDAYDANKSFYINDYQLKQSGGFSLALPESLKSKKGDLVHLRDSFLEDPTVTVNNTHYGSKATCSYHLADGIYLEYTIDIYNDSPLSEWKVSVENRPAINPENDLRVYSVAFPILDGLRIGANGTDDFLARPYFQGELIPNPVHYDYNRFGRSVPTNVLTYLGWASMSWMDMYDKSGGLYFASYDPSLQQIDLETFPDKEKNVLTLDIRTLAFTEPKNDWESQTFIVGIHEGDWHWAADTYRAWAKSWMASRVAPEWLEMADGWFGTGGPRYDYVNGLPQMLDDARWLGLNYLQVWSEMLENVGEDFSRKPYYCFFLPDPKRGGEQGMTAGVQKVREMGGNIGFYSNVWTYDAELPRPLIQWMDQIPAGVPIPDWWGGLRKSASVFPDGSVKAGDYLRKRTKEQYSGMCPAAEGWQDYLKYWIVDKYVKEYGVNAWYLDSFPVTMFGASRVCFSLEHGKESPHGIGRGCVELAKKLKESAAALGVTLALTSETANDALMQYQTHGLGIELVGRLSNRPYPEIYTYTFPEHLIFSGTSNTWKGIWQYYDDMPEPRHEDAMNRVFLLGYRFDAPGFPVKRDDPYWLYLKQLINLRHRIKNHLYKSSFKDDVGLGPIPKMVEVKAFRHNQGQSVSFTIVDRRQLKESFVITLDLSAYRVKPLTKAVFYDFTGEKQITMNAVGKRLDVTIPSREGTEPAAVIVE